MKTDILFFAPPIFADGGISRHLLANDNCKNNEIPRGALAIASYLEKVGKKSKVVATDSFFPNPVISHNELMNRTFSLLEEKLREFDPKYIGLSLMYGFAEKKIGEMAQYCKKAFPGKKIIVGGNHASFVSERILGSKYCFSVDMVVRGEGEKTVNDILSGLEPDFIPGISYRSDDRGVVHNCDRQDDSIMSLPPTNYALLNVGEGVSMANFNHMLQYTRGCSFKCSFCTNEAMWGGRTRAHSLDSFTQDLFSVLSFNSVTSPMPLTIFADDDVLAVPRYRHLFFSVLEDAVSFYPDARFVVQARVSTVYRDNLETAQMLRRAKEVNIEAICLGIETGSQVIMDAMNKHCKVDWIEPACENIKKHGIAVGGFWMFGHPGATSHEEELSVNVMESLLSNGLLDLVELHMTIPFPGTASRNDPRVMVSISEDEEVERYNLFDDKPIHSLIDPVSGKTVMGVEEIIEAYHNGIRVREAYLGGIAPQVDAEKALARV